MDETSDLVGYDLYLRHTDAAGHAVVREHRVWDGEKFALSQQAEAHKLNAEAKDGPRKAAVEVITREQYRMERRP